MADNQEHQKFDAGGVDDSGPFARSKKFRSNSCPARLGGSDPTEYLNRVETESYYDDDRDIAIGDFFPPPPSKDLPVLSAQDESDQYPSVFYPSTEERDTSPDEVQQLLDEVTERLTVLLDIGLLKKAEAQNVD
jgi:hypothetical protein